MASNSGQLALGALAAAVVGIGVVWLVPRPETAVVAPVEEAVAVPAEEGAVASGEGAAVSTTDEVAEAQTEAVETSPEEDVVAGVEVPTVGMRVEGDGIMVVTGRAIGASDLDILLDGEALERVLVGANGDFATVLSVPPSSQGRILSVIADPDGEAIASVENPLILPSVEQEPLIEDEVVVAGAVTSVDEGDLAEAADATEETPTEVVDLATDQSEAEDTTNTEVASEDAEVELEQLAEADAPDAVEELAEVQEPAEVVENTDLVSEEEALADASESPAIEENVAEIEETETVVAEAEATASEAASEADTQVEVTDATSTAEQTETQLVADEDGVRVVSTGPQVLSNVALDSISYDPTGAVLLTGRATGEGFVQVYVDNQPVTTSRITEGGDWRTDLPEVDTGVYTLRIDEVDAEGEVVSRIETPFKREEPEAVAAVLAEETAEDDFKVAVRTVQPGATLWAIAREQFGEGILYVAVYEANKDQIRDPDLIYPGQVFKIPELSE
ncbi:LysM domain-containing protein [Cognatiyoonia sediminum]|uniref:LysM domain-containing protein n=1 Tax=Cognatiyoonia sediminum TaxID=1508389 RepID=A0A1M5MRY4_9RHOB|nr:LysM peptidoglycan-binding domain-containing protein [Cognatiyoonia sediminum]SHG79543.1 LysM domain-containing protein [Cognatiyoonia sediminum]